MRPPAAFSGKCSRQMHEGGSVREKIGRNSAAGSANHKWASETHTFACRAEKRRLPLCKRKKAGGEGKIFLHWPRGCPILMRIEVCPIHKMLRTSEDKCPQQQRILHTVISRNEGKRTAKQERR